jgi:hypothetical protein
MLGKFVSYNNKCNNNADQYTNNMTNTAAAMTAITAAIAAAAAAAAVVNVHCGQADFVQTWCMVHKTVSACYSAPTNMTLPALMCEIGLLLCYTYVY